MRRALPAILLTAAGVAFVWRYEPVTPAQAMLPSPPASGTTTAQTRTVDGTAEQNRHGVVQVQVEFSGDRITGVRLLRLPDSGPSRTAAPRLVEETLRTQSAEIDTVSGATMTSQSYISSLQAAIDAKGA